MPTDQVPEQVRKAQNKVQVTPPTVGSASGTRPISPMRSRMS